ncbi:hypothetical protein Q7P37_002336 [Cladosporium fusiforme]
MADERIRRERVSAWEARARRRVAGFSAREAAMDSENIRLLEQRRMQDHRERGLEQWEEDVRKEVEELEERENALVEGQKALNEKEKALKEREKALEMAEKGEASVVAVVGKEKKKANFLESFRKVNDGL